MSRRRRCRVKKKKTEIKTNSRRLKAGETLRLVHMPRWFFVRKPRFAEMSALVRTDFVLNIYENKNAHNGTRFKPKRERWRVEEMDASTRTLSKSRYIQLYWIVCGLLWSRTETKRTAKALNTGKSSGCIRKNNAEKFIRFLHVQCILYTQTSWTIRNDEVMDECYQYPSITSGIKKTSRLGWPYLS